MDLLEVSKDSEDSDGLSGSLLTRRILENPPRPSTKAEDIRESMTVRQQSFDPHHHMNRLGSMHFQCGPMYFNGKNFSKLKFTLFQ